MTYDLYFLLVLLKPLHAISRKHESTRDHLQETAYNKEPVAQSMRHWYND